MNYEFLKQTWRRVHHLPAWLTKIVEAMGLSSDEENALAEIDEQAISKEKFLKRWRLTHKYHRPEPESAEWERAAKIRYLESKIINAKSRMIMARIASGRAMIAGNMIGELIFLDRATLAEKDIRHYSHEIERLSTIKENSGLNLDMIERARQRDIRDIVPHKNKMITCPFHADKKPSMSVAKGFAYCFVCQKNMNAIDWLVEVQQLSFVEAIQKLSGEVPAKILGDDPT